MENGNNTHNKSFSYKEIFTNNDKRHNLSMGDENFQ